MNKHPDNAPEGIYHAETVAACAMPAYPKPDIVAALTDAAHEIEHRGELMRGNLSVDKVHRRALWSRDVAKARLLRDLIRQYEARP